MIVGGSVICFIRSELHLQLVSRALIQFTHLCFISVECVERYRKPTVMSRHPQKFANAWNEKQKIHPFHRTKMLQNPCSCFFLIFFFSGPLPNQTMANLRRAMIKEPMKDYFIHGTQGRVSFRRSNETLFVEIYAQTNSSDLKDANIF